MAASLNKGSTSYINRLYFSLCLQGRQLPIQSPTRSCSKQNNLHSRKYSICSINGSMSFCQYHSICRVKRLLSVTSDRMAYSDKNNLHCFEPNYLDQVLARHLHSVTRAIQSSSKLKCILDKSVENTVSQKRKYASKRDRFDINCNHIYHGYLESLGDEYDKLTSALASQDVQSSRDKNLRLQELSPVVSLFRDIQQKYTEVTELDSLISGSDDTEMTAMATKEKQELLEDIKDKENGLVLMLAGESSVDKNDIILEVSAGVGGQEAMLFTREMYSMYENYAQFKGWAFQIIDYERSEIGGLRRASAAIEGTDVFKYLKFEGGVHRVQRVPRTEKSGRVHTSTMTVAILPQPDEIDVVIHAKDLHVETFRASGSGGQHVNNTDSAVRITHTPTKTVAECQSERSQIRNREIALQLIRSRIYQQQLTAQMAETNASRKLQIGTGGRSEKIRTYNFPQDRVTDHRLGENYHNIDVFLSGGEDLDDVIVSLMWDNKHQILDVILEDFNNKRKMNNIVKNT
ncbi:peptide chain release factor 1-like, mitochondrial [Haliotis asinina]|uniref:peptide chain release factor 1-like, mitochondrial n=1 Tax=Haliotis asinina TaxID=109174 RepID=UPI003531D09C